MMQYGYQSYSPWAKVLIFLLIMCLLGGFLLSEYVASRRENQRLQDTQNQIMVENQALVSKVEELSKQLRSEQSHAREVEAENTALKEELAKQMVPENAGDQKIIPVTCGVETQQSNSFSDTVDTVLQKLGISPLLAILIMISIDVPLCVGLYTVIRLRYSHR